MDENKEITEKKNDEEGNQIYMKCSENAIYIGSENKLDSWIYKDSNSDEDPKG